MDDILGALRNRNCQPVQIVVDDKENVKFVVCHFFVENYRRNPTNKFSVDIVEPVVISIRDVVYTEDLLNRASKVRISQVDEQPKIKMANPSIAWARSYMKVAGRTVFVDQLETEIFDKKKTSTWYEASEILKIKRLAPILTFQQFNEETKTIISSLQQNHKERITKSETLFLRSKQNILNDLNRAVELVTRFVGTVETRSNLTQQMIDYYDNLEGCDPADWPVVVADKDCKEELKEKANCDFAQSLMSIESHLRSTINLANSALSMADKKYDRQLMTIVSPTALSKKIVE